MTFYTENGYAVLTQQDAAGQWQGMWGVDPPLTTDGQFLGGILSGPAEQLAAWHVAQYVARVEPIGVDDKGNPLLEAYDWRSKRGSSDNLQDPGSVDWSEHAAATAWDINAPAHPLDRSKSGRDGYIGFTDAQVAAIRAISASTDFDGNGPLVLDGGEWGDGMHHERNKGATDARIVAFLATQPNGDDEVGTTPEDRAAIAQAVLTQPLPDEWADKIANRIFTIIAKDPGNPIHSILIAGNDLTHKENADGTGTFAGRAVFAQVPDDQAAAEPEQPAALIDTSGMSPVEAAQAEGRPGPTV